MKRRTLLAAAAALVGATAVVGAGTPAGAITFGTETGNMYGNVGSLVGKVNGTDDAYQWCTGTLISPTVFLTAAHCFDGYLGEDSPVTFHVTFDEVIDGNRDGLVDLGVQLLSGTAIPHEKFATGGANDTYDIAVFVLDPASAAEVADITPASLPSPNWFAGAGKKAKDFVAVGYGTERNVKQGGPNAFDVGWRRKYAVQSINSVTKAWVTFSMNPANGNAGTCYGDSGGPHFAGAVGNASLVVSITVTGDYPCRATDKTYRLDTPNAREFLGRFVTVPN